MPNLRRCVKIHRHVMPFHSRSKPPAAMLNFCKDEKGREKGVGLHTIKKRGHLSTTIFTQKKESSGRPKIVCRPGLEPTPDKTFTVLDRACQRTKQPGWE